MIRKVEITYNHGDNGMPSHTSVYYTGGFRTSRFYYASETLPKTVVKFIAEATECKTYRNYYGDKTDVYTA